MKSTIVYTLGFPTTYCSFSSDSRQYEHVGGCHYTMNAGVEFTIDVAASIPFALTMVGFAIGNGVIGRIVDQHRITKTGMQP